LRDVPHRAAAASDDKVAVDPNPEHWIFLDLTTPTDWKFRTPPETPFELLLPLD
jgi:hypothetical protein